MQLPAPHYASAGERVWPESQFSRVFEQETIRLTALSRYLLHRTAVRKGGLAEGVTRHLGTSELADYASRKSGSKEGKQGDSPSRLIDARIAALSDWRGETLARVRSLIKQADPT
jgi:hypothetical protein